MRKEERLLALLTQLPDDLLEEAVTYQKPAAKIVPGNQGALVAACFCAFLIGGLVWSTVLEQREDAKTTAAGWTTVAAGGQTLAPTGGQVTDATGATSAAISEFCYEGQWYGASGFLLTELPAHCVYQGVLYCEEPDAETQAIMTVMENWLTRDPALAGAKVYRLVGDYTGFYVETEGGYVYYGAESVAYEQSGETEGDQ